LFNAFGKVCVLGQKTIARMNRLRVRDLGRRNDGGYIEVAFFGGSGAYADRLIGKAYVLGLGVGG
jgi:hypothetical protein